MLLPAQVIPFLNHDDALLRRQARDYFRDCPNPGPLLADDYWPVLDRVGEGNGEMDDEGSAVAYELAHAPQTERSIHRLIDALAARPSAGYVHHYEAGLGGVEFPLLVEHHDLLLGCPHLSPHTAARLRHRLELVDVPAEPVWDQLMAFGQASTGKYSDKVDWGQARALIEAAARHIDVLAAPALATLEDAAARGYQEIFAVMVLGNGRHEPATGALVDKLDVDADLLREEAVRALSRIGTADVANRLAAFIPGRRWDVRLYAHGPLEHVKRPESEAALLNLISTEDDDELIVQMLHDLSNLGSLAGLDAVRKYTAHDPRDAETIGLYEALVATAVMLGVTLPEEARWRKRIAEHQAAVVARVKALDRMGLRELAQRLFAGGSEVDAPTPKPPTAPSPPPVDFDPYAKLKPIRNATAKVGRNDPCPCGSGKKHKKCCGAGK